MVSPGAYAEYQERRRRRRYAVLSALGESGFVPRDAEALNAFPFSFAASQRCETLDIDAIARAPSSPLIPYEWYDYEPKADEQTTGSVVVLWLDEAKFQEQPLHRLQQLLRYVLCKVLADRGRGIKAVVLGPARSGTLRKMVSESNEKNIADSANWLRKSSKLTEFLIVSPYATVADAELRKRWTQGSPSLLGKTFTADCHPKSPSTCLRFLRTINSDDLLIKRLVDELKKRRVKPETDTTVVISEWDTYFGRSLPREFAADYCPDPNHCKQLLRYTYQRGIDGITAGEEEVQPAASDIIKNTKKQRAAFPMPELSSVRRPVGTGQFDYLRRLATGATRRPRPLRGERHAEIGIVGGIS